jgi:glutamate racemase
MSIPDIKYRPRIGLFDSGRGGFSVLTALLELQLDVDYLYFADHAFAPYGGLEEEQILDRSRAISQILLNHSVDLIVLACNTATAIAIDQLRSEFSIPFVGIEPFLTAAQKSAIPVDERADQVVLVTPSMYKSKRFKKLCERRDPEGQVRVHACPTMAWAIERAFDHEEAGAIIQSALGDLDPLKNQGLKYAILGCTHYPLIAQKIADYLAVKTLSPCRYVAKRAAEQLALNPYSATTKAQVFYASSNDGLFKKLELDQLQLVARD